MSKHKVLIEDTQGSGVIDYTTIFTDKEDYDLTLSKLRNDFMKRWSNDKPSPETGLDEFDVIATLGAGAFGRVKLVKARDTNQYYACKVLSKEKVVKTKQTPHVYSEKRILAAVRFPFVIHLIFSRKDNPYLYLGLPFIRGGELFTYHRKMQKFNENQTRFYAAQVFLAFEYLHFMNVLYRDLKPENIMIDQSGYIKLTDFGFCKKVETRTWTLCGTPEYLAPELIQSKPYATSVDWWTFGIFIYEMVAGSSPFAIHSRDVMTMYAKICEGEYKIPSYFSPPLKDLIKNLLIVDVSQRLGNLSSGSKGVKEHDFFKTIDWIAMLRQQMNPPYVPRVTDMEDLSHFDKFPTEKKEHPRNRTHKYDTQFNDF